METLTKRVELVEAEFPIDQALPDLIGDALWGSGSLILPEDRRFE